MDNLKLYNAVRKVPEEAKKSIQGGRLKGMTDINPMYRIKTLTEQFGACGLGWYYKVVNKWTEQGANNEIATFAEIELYIKDNGEWSQPIYGVGGSMFVANERSGLYTSDECYKMAITDALSVACKQLGVGADVYWEKDRSKYAVPEDKPKDPKPEKTTETYKCMQCEQMIKDLKTKTGIVTASEIAKRSLATYGTQLCTSCSLVRKKQNEANGS